MKKNYSWHNRSSIITALVFSLFFTACHFDSDKDYKRYDNKDTADSPHHDAHGQDQHKASNPPVDAAKHGDSTNNAVPVTSKDTLTKKD